MAQNAVYQQYPANYAGKQYQFSNILLNVTGTYFPFIVSLSYSDTNDVAEGRGVSVPDGHHARRVQSDRQH